LNKIETYDILDIFHYTLDKGGGQKWSSNGMPSMIKLKPILGKSDVQKFIHELEVPISKVFPSNRRKAHSLQFQFGTDKTKIFTHMCIICLYNVLMLGENKHNASWEKGVEKMRDTFERAKALGYGPRRSRLYPGTTEEESQRRRFSGCIVSCPS